MFLNRVKKLNKHVLLAITLLLTSGLFFISSYGISLANSGKVTLCHVTGSKTNPFVKITVASDAKPAHLKHGDFETTPNGSCAAPTVTPTGGSNTPTPTNTPTNTPVPNSPTPTNTPTNTPVPNSPTPTNTPTNTPVPNSPTPTNTPTPTPSD